MKFTRREKFIENFDIHGIYFQFSIQYAEFAKIGINDGSLLHSTENFPPYYICCLLKYDACFTNFSANLPLSTNHGTPALLSNSCIHSGEFFSMINLSCHFSIYPIKYAKVIKAGIQDIRCPSGDN